MEQAAESLATIGILVSIFGALNGYIMTGMRIPYAMAAENKLPFSEFFSKLHRKFGTPVNGGILLAAISVIMIFSGKFDQLTDLVMFVIWIFYTMTFVSVFILKKTHPDLHRPYKVPLLPIRTYSGNTWRSIYSNKHYIHAANECGNRSCDTYRTSCILCKKRQVQELISNNTNN